MGNIQRRIFSLNPNGDNPSTRSQQHNNSSTSQQIGGFNPNKQSLLQLTISDPLQHEQIMSNISLYSQQNGLSPSISQLKEYYKVKKQGYCTNQYVFYLIFNGCGCCGLKDQFGVRKMMSKKFQDQQIVDVMKTYLAGLLVYVKEFKRKIDKIDLDDIGFQTLSGGQKQPSHNNQTHRGNLYPQHSNSQGLQNAQKYPVRMYFIDPWLKQRRQQQIVTVNEVNVLLQNPSPQRLDQSYNLYNHFNNKAQSGQMTQNGQRGGSKSSHNKQNEGYSKKLQSLLFSIGVIGLKMLEMGFVDDIYVKLPQKKVNFEKVQQYIEKHNNMNSLNRGNHPNGAGNNPSNNGQNSINGSYNHHEKYTTTAVTMIRQKLIGGLKILLLSNTPKDREKIFDFWNVNLKQTNILNDISLENGTHLQPEMSTQSSEMHPANNAQNAVENTSNFQRQNINGYQLTNQNKVHPLNNKNGGMGVNQDLNAKNKNFIHRQRLYSVDDPAFRNPQNANTNVNFQSNRNELNNHSHQYVYKVDQFRHYPQSILPNSQNVYNHNVVQQAYIQSHIKPQISFSPQKHQISTFPIQIQTSSNTQNYYPYTHQSKHIHESKPIHHQQYSSPSINLNHHVVHPNQISQNAYFSRLQYKLPQKNTN